MKIESLINEAYFKIKNKEIVLEEENIYDYLSFDDFVNVCVEASKYLVSSFQNRNVINIINLGFDEEYIEFYINKYISNNPIFEAYKIKIETIEDYFEFKRKKEKYPLIRTKVTFPINLLFDKENGLRRAKN